MALVNVAGCLGMVVGPAVGGIVSAVARDPSDVGHAYRVVFAVAGAALVGWWLLGAPWMWRRSFAAKVVGEERQEER